MYAATLRFGALIRPCRALIEVRLHVSNLPHPCWNSVESHESIDKSEKRGCSTRLRSNFFFLAEFNTKINTPPPAYLLACIKRIACMVVVKEKMYVVPEEKQLSYDL